MISNLWKGNMLVLEEEEPNFYQIIIIINIQFKIDFINFITNWILLKFMNLSSLKELKHQSIKLLEVFVGSDMENIC